jgi:hypothetical protein
MVQAVPPDISSQDTRRYWHFAANLRSLSDRYLTAICIKYIIYIMYIFCVIHIIHIIYLDSRLLQLFKTVFPYRNRAGSLIMDNEKVHWASFHQTPSHGRDKLCKSCDWPEGGHKTWVHEHGLRTNQGPTTAMTVMTHSLKKVASHWKLLCDTMSCQLEHGDATAEDWTDSKGNSLCPDRFGALESRSSLPPTMKGHTWGSS